VRVLQVVDVLAPVGGAQTYLREASELLLAAGHEVGVLHEDASAVAPAGVETCLLDAPGTAGWILDFEPELAHVHSARLLPHAERLLAGIPRVHSLHDFAFGCASGTKYFRGGRVCTRAHGPGCFAGAFVGGCVHRLDPRPFLKRYGEIEHELPALRAAGNAIVHSEFMRSVALANGLAAERVHVVPYFVARAAQPPDPVAERTIAFAGRVVPEKGLDVLLDALATSPGSWDRLRVAGDGWDLDRCRRLADRLGIASKVEFLGHVEAAGARRAFGHARVVVVPSRWPEPFGLVGLEAMACARPVVASATGGIPEWLDGERTGLLVPPGDVEALASAIVSLLDDADRAAAMGLEGWRRVERFSPESSLQRLLAVYERAVGAPRSLVAGEARS
jgi:glycosyltransferase involved in cell wall biosynthesis